jgi:uncharacterized protein YecE (DUF72 family)
MNRTDLHWRVGTIGFSYPEWRNVFYPRGVAAGNQLPYYAQQFDTLELDTTFHAMPSVHRVERWAAQVPDGFCMSVKTPKQITHETPPAAAVTLMRLFLDTLAPLGRKLGAVVLQFPPTIDAASRDDVLKLLDATLRGTPAAVEFRHRSWQTPAVAAALRDRGIALVANDLNDRTQPVVPTGRTFYLRFIGQHERFAAKNREEYDTTERLAWWIEQVETAAPPDATVFAVFGNDYAGYAIATAKRLLRLLGRDVPEPPEEPGEATLFD